MGLAGRFVHCSSHHALVRHPLEQPLDEGRPLALDEPCDYHRSKAHAEKLIQDLVRERGLDAVVVSPGTMIGPWDYAPSMMGKALLESRELFEILRLPAHIDHPIDRARPAQHAPPWVVDAAPIRSRIGFRLEPPGQRRMLQHAPTRASRA